MEVGTEGHERKNNKGKKRVLEWIYYLLRHGRFYGVLGSGASDPHPHFVLDQIARRSQVPEIALALQGEPVPIATLRMASAAVYASVIVMA